MREMVYLPSAGAYRPITDDIETIVVQGLNIVFRRLRELCSDRILVLSGGNTSSQRLIRGVAGFLTESTLRVHVLQFNGGLWWIA